MKKYIFIRLPPSSWTVSASILHYLSVRERERARARERGGRGGGEEREREEEKN